MGLIDNLTSQFGLTPEQAQGAIGAIGRTAQSKLAPEQFGELGKLIPGLGQMIGAAPKAGGGMLGGLGGMLGGGLGEAAQLASVFQSLGIDTARIKPIAAMVLGFINSNGSPGLKAAVAPWAAKLGL